MSTTESNINPQFLEAIRLGDQVLARALLPRVNWTDLNLETNPFENVLNWQLWMPRSHGEFLRHNRDEVSKYAYSEYDLSGMTVVDDGGVESCGDVWQRAVFVEPEYEGDPTKKQKNRKVSTSVRYNFSITFHEKSCQIAAVGASSPHGETVGELPEFENLHKKVALQSTRDQMPGFVMEVLKWCRDNDSCDLLINLHEKRYGFITPPDQRFLHRLLGLGQFEAAIALLDAGADPYEMSGYLDKPICLIDAIEKNVGNDAAHVIKSHLLRRAALAAMSETGAATYSPVKPI